MYDLNRLATLVLALLFASPAFSVEKKCEPAPPDVAVLKELRPGFHKVEGVLAKFDPCHASVHFSTPSFFATKLADKPPLMIIAHGGGGLGMAEQEMAKRMNANGVAALVFDAYELNGFKHKGTVVVFWAVPGVDLPLEHHCGDSGLRQHGNGWVIHLGVEGRMFRTRSGPVESSGQTRPTW